LAFLALTAAASAQDVASGITSVLKEMKFRDLLPKHYAIPPGQPQVGDPTERTGELPKPGDTTPRQFVIYQGTPSMKGSKVYIKDNVHFANRGYEVFADAVEGDQDTNVYKATGHVKVYGKDAFIRGDEVTINFRNNTFLARDAYVDARPSLLGGYALKDLYIKGGELYGSRQEIFGNQNDVTSCDLDKPHFHLQSAKMTVRPGKRAIFRKVSIIVLNRTILKLPYLSLPLDQRTYRYMPEIGQSFDEGYYVKFRFGVPLRGDSNNLLTHVDYYTKKGPGLGFDYSYNSLPARGIISAYSVLGSDKTFTLNTRHRSDFKLGVLTLDTNYQQNDYLTAPDSSIFGARLGFLLRQSRTASTKFGYTFNDNNSGGFDSQSQTFSLGDARKWSKTFQTSLDLGYSKADSTSGTTTTDRQQLDVKFKAEEDLQKATAQFLYQRTIPVGETSNFFSGTDQTPVISLLSDSNKLFGRKNNFILPFRAELSVGEFANSLDQTKVSRGNLDLNFNRPDRSNNRLKFDMTGRFKQDFYSDGTAQYNLGLGMVGTYTLGRDTSLNVRYNYLRPYGFSPLQIDRLGQTNLVSGDLSVRPIRSLLVGAQTGYDMLQLQTRGTPWQMIGARMEYRPTDYISIRSLATYDTFQRAWSNMRIDMAYKPGATFVGLGMKYDGIRKVWSSAEGFVDGFKWGRMRTSAMMTYNGYLQRFESRQFQFTYDLHCWEAVLTVIDNPIGFRTGTSINFTLRIKAFPFNTGFGTGTSGQPIGIGGVAGGY